MLGVFIPILEGSTIKVEILGKNFGIVSILGIIVAIIVGIMSHWKFESRWKHYRLNAEIIRVEGEDFFALSNKYSEFEKHSDAYEKFMGIITSFKRKETKLYIESMDNQSKTSDD